MMDEEWTNHEYPPDGTWCWVTNGKAIWVAHRGERYSGGWSNEDTWEDFDKSVIAWVPLKEPKMFGLGIDEEE
jgi:hypothetical protein